MSALEKSPSKMTLSRDGKYAIALFTGQVRGAGEAPAAAVPLGGGEAIPILSDAQAPQAVDVSPDGKWIAYESRETGHHEVYVSPFPTGSGQIQVSEKSGDDPQWFRAATLDVSGAIPRVVHIDTLFAKRNHTDDRISTFSVHPDGRHFVVTHPLGDPVTLNVVTNWLAEARARFARR
jgi:hypothetical protein